MDCHLYLFVSFEVKTLNQQDAIKFQQFNGNITNILGSFFKLQKTNAQ